jgi:hypothetical protein
MTPLSKAFDNSLDFMLNIKKEINFEQSFEREAGGSNKSNISPSNLNPPASNHESLGNHTLFDDVINSSRGSTRQNMLSLKVEDIKTFINLEN